MLLQHQQPLLCAGRAVGGKPYVICGMCLGSGVVRVARAYGDRTC